MEQRPTLGNRTDAVAGATGVDLDRLTRPFPAQAVLQRTGAGGKSLSYLPTHTVIHRLNDATANRWDFRLTRLDLMGDTYVAVGELTIPGLGTRTGIGVQRVADRAGEDLVKGAASDCLKKCATLFGVGIELYGPDYEAGEVESTAATAGAGETAPMANRHQASRAPVSGAQRIRMSEGGEKHWLLKVDGAKTANDLDAISVALVNRFGKDGVAESVWTALAARNRQFQGNQPEREG